MNTNSNDHALMMLPEAVSVGCAPCATGTLERYFDRAGRPISQQFTGAYFDVWPDPNPNAFNADDLFAITCLSVSLPPWSADTLVNSARLSSLLAQVVNEDLADINEEMFESSRWSAAVLMAELQELPGVGLTKASKLLARKRPRVRPIYDSVVAGVLGDHGQFWTSCRDLMRTTISFDGPVSDARVHDWLTVVQRDAAMPTVSALRVLDVLAWMQGTGNQRRCTAHGG